MRQLWCGGLPKVCVRFGPLGSDVSQNKLTSVPVGLLEGGKVLTAVKKGELLTTGNAAPDPTTNLFRLRRLQDQMFGLA